MDQDVVVRRASDADLPALARVVQGSRAAAFVGHPMQEKIAGLSIERYIEIYRERWAEPNREAPFLWLLELRGHAAGMAEVGESREQDLDPTGLFDLTSFYLLPEFWGRGLAQRLFEIVLEDLRGLGATGMLLWVRAPNERARHFYERAGMSTDGVWKGEAPESGLLRYRMSL